MGKRQISRSTSQVTKPYRMDCVRVNQILTRCMQCMPNTIEILLLMQSLSSPHTYIHTYYACIQLKNQTPNNSEKQPVENMGFFSGRPTLGLHFHQPTITNSKFNALICQFVLRAVSSWAIARWIGIGTRSNSPRDLVQRVLTMESERAQGRGPA